MFLPSPAVKICCYYSILCYKFEYLSGEVRELFEICSHSSVRSYVWKALAAVAFFALAALLFTLRAPGGRLLSTADRCAYLSARGYCADPASETVKEIVLPKEFDGLLADYNALQLTAGYDLRAAAGRRCTLYTYELTDFPDWDGRVLAVLYVYHGRVIAGDVHTASVEGFLRPLRGLL